MAATSYCCAGHSCPHGHWMSQGTLPSTGVPAEPLCSIAGTWRLGKSLTCAQPHSVKPDRAAKKRRQSSGRTLPGASQRCFVCVLSLADKSHRDSFPLPPSGRGGGWDWWHGDSLRPVPAHVQLPPDAQQCVRLSDARLDLPTGASSPVEAGDGPVSSPVFLQRSEFSGRLVEAIGKGTDETGC